MMEKKRSIVLFLLTICIGFALSGCTPKLPAETLKIIDEIHSHYYSYIDKNVDNVRWIHKEADTDDYIRILRQKGAVELAEQCENRKIIVVYKPSTDLLDIKVHYKNKNALTDNEQNKIEKFSRADIELIESTWNMLKRYLIGRPINLKDSKVESIEWVGEDLVVKTINKDEVKDRATYTFNRKYRLKSVVVSVFKPPVQYKATFDFELDKSKYLVKAIKIDGDLRGKFAIDCQVLNGVKIPKEVVVVHYREGATPRKVKELFVDAEVTLKH